LTRPIYGKITEEEYLERAVTYIGKVEMNDQTLTQASFIMIFAFVHSYRWLKLIGIKN